MLRHFVFITVFVLLSAGITSPLLAAEESDWRMDFRPGYSWLLSSDDNESRQGFSVGAMGSWRAFDMLFLKLDLETMFLNIKAPGNALFLTPQFGFNYDIDLAPILPTIGSGIGPIFSKTDNGDGKSTEWEIDAVWHLLLSIQYFVTNDVGLGVEGRYQFIFTNLNTNPMIFTVSAKVSIAL